MTVGWINFSRLHITRCMGPLVLRCVAIVFYSRTSTSQFELPVELPMSLFGFLFGVLHLTMIFEF